MGALLPNHSGTDVPLFGNVGYREDAQGAPRFMLSAFGQQFDGKIRSAVQHTPRGGSLLQ